MNILITGGASGLGKAITEKLASEGGNRVYFTYNRSAEAAKNIEKIFPNAKGIKCDFGNEEEFGILLSRIAEIDPDVLVNNAFSGTIEKQHFHKGGVERFKVDFLNNIVPVIELTQHAITVFRKKKSGKIVTILSSAIVNRPPVGWSAYTAGKAYLHSLAKSWAVENAAFNISSNSISPDFMQTALTADTDERVIEEMKNGHPLKKLLSTDEVAGAVSYFVSSSPHINGVNMVINAAGNIS
jgi:NAD(P)-dependent dehydrogenase (short-subunit alcohol dehydrogenase family)